MYVVDSKPTGGLPSSPYNHIMSNRW